MKIGRVLRSRRSTPQAPPPPPPSVPPKLALLIGIDYVDAATESEYPPLRRARIDTKDFRDLLISKYDYLPENVVMMLDEEGIWPNLWPTRANILYQISKLVRGAREGSRFVFFFSGHSGQIEDTTHEEDDGFDEFIVPVDHAQWALSTLFPSGAHLTAIFDSCHSGTMLDLDHYLCNNVYYPWMDLGNRRHMTKWLGVRRKDGQRMSQSGVKVVTKRHSHPDSKGKPQSASSSPTRESSLCSVRIYQRRRTSESQMEVINTSVGVTDDGKRRQFSVQSRRASVQCKPTLSLAQVTEGEQSILSLAEEEAWPRCSSPTSIKTCSGFCEAADKPPDGPSVLSISSCQDSQRTWESKKGSFTQWLIELLRLEPRQPIGKFLQELTHKMYDHAQKTHRWSQRQKDNYKITHPRDASDSTLQSTGAAEAEVERSGRQMQEHALDVLDFVSVPEPQLGAQQRVDLDQPIIL
ncbi:caspase domain-containing protein [Cerioporus squamosus]|nr:caspase domain-containing protein [Cerioporus squamosus]